MKSLSFLFLLLFMVTNSLASIISLDASPYPAKYLSTSGSSNSWSSNFDLTAQLPLISGISSGYGLFTFIDDNFDYLGSTTTFNHSNNNYSSSSYTYWDKVRAYEAEQAQVTVGGQVKSGTSQSFNNYIDTIYDSNSWYVSTGHREYYTVAYCHTEYHWWDLFHQFPYKECDYERRSRWVNDGYTFYDYNITKVYNSGYGGSWTVALDLTNLELDTLLTTGLLDFSVNAIWGDFMLQSATLSLDVVDAQQSDKIPEPSTFILMAVGLAGLSFSRKRKYRYS